MEYNIVNKGVILVNHSDGQQQLFVTFDIENDSLESVRFNIEYSIITNDGKVVYGPIVTATAPGIVCPGEIGEVKHDYRVNVGDCGDLSIRIESVKCIYNPEGYC